MWGHVLHFLSVQSTNESRNNKTKRNVTKGNKSNCDDIELPEH